MAVQTANTSLLKKESRIRTLNFFKKKDLLGLVENIRGKPLDRGPYHVEIEITDRCNARCYFCNQKKVTKAQLEMPFGLFRKIVSALQKEGLRSIRLSGGGEPTIHPQLIRILDFIYKSNLHINAFNTNGILLTREISQRLLRCKLALLYVSLNSSIPQTWAKINGCQRDDFYRVLENVKEFIRQDKPRTVKIVGGFIIDEPTSLELPSMMRLCEELDITFQIKDLNNYPYSNRFFQECIPLFLKDMFLLATGDTIGGFSGLIELPQLFIFAERMRELFGGGESKYSLCFAPWTSVLIRTNGDVYPCCNLGSGKYAMGNIFKEDFMDIWKNVKFDKFRLEYKDRLFNKRNRCGEYDLSKCFLEQNSRRGPCKVKNFFLYPELEMMIRRGSKRL